MQVKTKLKLDLQNMKCTENEHISVPSQEKKHQKELKIWCDGVMTIKN